MPDDVYGLILAGGRGSRFWPLSRRSRPKQCLALDGAKTLLAGTVSRVAPLIPVTQILVLTGPDMEVPVRGALPELEPSQFLVEPSARNTAPCIAWGTKVVESKAGGSAVVVVLPADHRVGLEEEFRTVLDRAIRLARESGDIVTLGVQPDRPETGYGYLEVGDPLEGDASARPVVRFCEKPDIDRARQWLKGGNHLWNAGIFVFRVDAMIRELKAHLPATAEALQDLGDGEATLVDVWPRLEATSIDYGLMERCRRILTLPVSVEWSDLGDWETVGALLPEIRGGKGLCKDSVAQDARDCVVHAPNQVVALVGVEDLIVVSTPDAILVMPRSMAQEARTVPELLDGLGLSDYT